MPIIVHFLETHVYNYDSDFITVSILKNDILKLNNLPDMKICLTLNGKFLFDDNEIDSSNTSILRASIAGGLKGF